MSRTGALSCLQSRRTWILNSPQVRRAKGPTHPSVSNVLAGLWATSVEWTNRRLRYLHPFLRIPEGNKRYVVRVQSSSILWHYVTRSGVFRHVAMTFLLYSVTQAVLAQVGDSALLWLPRPFPWAIEPIYYEFPTLSHSWGELQTWGESRDVLLDRCAHGSFRSAKTARELPWGLGGDGLKQVWMGHNGSSLSSYKSLQDKIVSRYRHCASNTLSM